MIRRGVLRPVVAGLLSLAGIAFSTPALPHEALERLVPLIEVYNANKDTPAFDVAGIRCAGLFVAQNEWAKTHPRDGRPSAAQLQDVEDNLTRAEQQRRNEGQDLVSAQESVRTDVLRVYELYSDRFAAAARNGGHPWADDPLIKGDTTYCNVLNGRR